MKQFCMFADGSNVIRRVAKRILATPELTVLESGTGAEALEICRRTMPHIVVVSTNLPDMEATDLIREIRAIKNALTPRILISLVEMDVGTIMRARRAGAEGYLLKPFDRNHLLGCLQTMKIAA
ncbi:response regulator [Aquamicrobium defluvii]|uniref:Chemotaxis protein CheY n=1 Tax=Aquamicrobium defluvii TaxID=69279 RepID=A0A011UEB0_9HYPH|nr:response regulator [Aquamicrobium defluvii]EXL04461.1 chemotaxis protein CheY [Aquamicrobium defluvii]EZQ14121.1 chemotaxis protein CheY [Halopseudomonas bauzanensis]TDR34472.1 response regulator receiver protein [Aquamicrobium defluvii]